MLLPTLVTAAVVGMLAPWAYRLAWEVPFGHLSRAMVLRSGFSAAVGTFLIGALLEGCLSVTSGPTSGAVGAAVGGGFMSVLTFLNARRSRRQRGALLLSLRLRERDVGAETHDRLLQLLARARMEWQREPDRYADLVFRVITPLTDAGFWSDAEILLAGLEALELSPEQRAHRSQGIVTCRIRLLDLEGAERALSEAERPASVAPVETWLRTLDAYVRALDGRGAEALRILDEEAPSLDPSIELSRSVVRAHALAGVGRVDEARALVEELREAGGSAALEQVVAPEGPASSLAREVAQTPEG